MHRDTLIIKYNIILRVACEKMFIFYLFYLNFLYIIYEDNISDVSTLNHSLNHRWLTVKHLPTEFSRYSMLSIP